MRSIIPLACLALLAPGPVLAVSSTVQGRPPPPPLIHGNWCGLGDANRRAPIDALDAACRAHDLCYERLGRGACSCDRAFLRATAALTQRRSSDETMRTLASMANTLFAITPCVETGESPLRARKR